jgi:hypothetical protein
LSHCSGIEVVPVAQVIYHHWMTPDAFRRLALAFPDTRESSHVDHPDFRVGKKIFATLGYPDARWGMVKLTPGQQAQFVASDPGVFAPVKGGWGLRGSTNIKLRPATHKAVRSALAAAWRNTASATLIKKHPDIG